MAAPSRVSDTNPSTCSRTNSKIAMTPIARKPGISRTVCSKPMSDPSKSATSITKLFSSADHVLKAMGMASAMRNSRATGRRQNGRPLASSRVI